MEEKNINRVLIRLMDVDSGNLLKTFYTENPEAFLKWYNFMVKMEYPFTLQDEDSLVYIRDFEFGFGGGEYIPCITVYGEVI